MPIRHRYTSPIVDDGNANEVGPNEWNAAHAFPFRVVAAGETLAADDPLVAALPEGASDPFLANVVSHLRFNGTDNSTTFTDETGKVWTASGNARLSAATPRNGTAAGSFDAATATIITTPAVTDFAFPGDFTIEFDVRLAGTRSSPQVIFATSTDAPGTGGLVLALVSNTRLLNFGIYQPNTTIAQSPVPLVDNV